MVHHDRYVWCPSGEFIDPIGDSAERTEYEKGAIGALFAEESEERNELYSFPQAHLIC